MRRGSAASIFRTTASVERSNPIILASYSFLSTILPLPLRLRFPVRGSVIVSIGNGVPLGRNNDPRSDTGRNPFFLDPGLVDPRQTIITTKKILEWIRSTRIQSTDDLLGGNRNHCGGCFFRFSTTDDRACLTAVKFRFVIVRLNPLIPSLCPIRPLQKGQNQKRELIFSRFINYGVPENTYCLRALELRLIGSKTLDLKQA